VVASPSPSPAYNELDGVSCVSATACTAVGSYSSGGANTRTLVESWDGANWSVVPSPSPAPSYNQLDGVSCVSAAACTAAGTDAGTGSNSSSTLIESGSASG